MTKKILYQTVVHLCAFIGMYWIVDYSNTFIFGDVISNTRQLGITYMHRAWNMQPLDPSIGYQIEIPDFTVNVVGSITELQTEWNRFGDPNKKVVGFTRVFRPRNRMVSRVRTEIWIIGKRAPDGSIMFNHETLGHELQHVLRTYQPDIYDPDRMLP